MKTKVTFLACFGALALALTTLGQTPTPPLEPTAPPAATLPPDPASTVAPIASPIPAAATTPTIAPVLTPSPSPETEEDFDKAVERKIKSHFNFATGDHRVGDDAAWIAVPIVLIVFLTIFGLPVAVVGIILYFSFSKSRAMHKTVRMMVEKGQPVPEALLNPPPVVRQRSDLRRGVVLLMVGAGLMIFFGACNDWEGGAWSLGVIPFLIGLGYLLVWKLDARATESSPKV